MTAPPEYVRVATRDAIRAHMLIHAFRVRGHTEADLEPLGLREVASHPDLDRPLELPNRRGAPVPGILHQFE